VKDQWWTDFTVLAVYPPDFVVVPARIQMTLSASLIIKLIILKFKSVFDDENLVGKWPGLSRRKASPVRRGMTVDE
jgi:hypothetical protein